MSDLSIRGYAAVIPRLWNLGLTPKSFMFSLWLFVYLCAQVGSKTYCSLAPFAFFFLRNLVLATVWRHCMFIIALTADLGSTWHGWRCVGFAANQGLDLLLALKHWAGDFTFSSLSVLSFKMRMITPNAHIKSTNWNSAHVINVPVT